MLFAPLLLPIGYVAGWFTNVFEFRASTPPWRVLSSLVLAAAICPTVAYWTVWLGGSVGAALVFGAFLLLACFLLAGTLGHERMGTWLAPFRGVGWAAYAIPLTWLAIAIFSLVDLQIGDRLYFNGSAYDHSLRTEFTHSITSTGVPPRNPLFHLNGAAPLRYHYFWFILCSFVESIGGRLLNGSHAGSFLNSRQAMIGSIVWAGWALVAIIPLYFRFFYRQSGEALRRRALIGVILLSVTGLDLIPTLIYYVRWHYLYFDMEWWNMQISAWVSIGLWVPHHLIAFVSCLTGFLLIWQGAQRTTTENRLWTALLAGFAFATAVGTSVFVTLVFAVFFALWIAMCFWKGWRHYAPVLVLAGLVAIVLITPQLLQISSKGGGGAFLRFHIRDFSPLDRVMADHHLGQGTRDLLRLLFLPVNYGLELGFYLLAGVFYWWRVRQRKIISPADTVAALLFWTSLLISTFLSSSLVNNDLGVRGFMPAQFVLLLWGADWIAHWKEDAVLDARLRFAWPRSLAKACLAIGVAGSVYAVMILRFYGLATDHGISKSEFFPHGETGRHIYAFRQAYEQLRQLLPPSAIVQTNPAGRFNDFPFGLYSLRQTAAMNDTCGAEFGGDPSNCAKDYAAIEDIFSDQTRPTAEDVKETCQRYSIDALVMRDTDGAWVDRESWMWKLEPIIANSYVRVYRMSAGT